MTTRETYLIKLIQSQNVALSILKGLVPEPAQSMVDETIKISSQGIQIIRNDDRKRVLNLTNSDTQSRILAATKHLKLEEE